MERRNFRDLSKINGNVKQLQISMTFIYFGLKPEFEFLRRKPNAWKAALIGVHAWVAK